MSTVQANIRLNIPDDVDMYQYIELLKSQITKLNGRPTKVNVIEVDDPVTTARIQSR